jgi:hypothetical protein
MIKSILIMLVTLSWVIPLLFALSNILNYEHFAITFKCLYFSFGVLGYLITNKLIE